jgi:hypothetical protein
MGPKNSVVRERHAFFLFSFVRAQLWFRGHEPWCGEGACSRGCFVKVALSFKELDIDVFATFGL